MSLAVSFKARLSEASNACRVSDNWTLTLNSFVADATKSFFRLVQSLKELPKFKHVATRQRLTEESVLENLVMKNSISKFLQSRIDAQDFPSAV